MPMSHWLPVRPRLENSLETVRLLPVVKESILLPVELGLSMPSIKNGEHASNRAVSDYGSTEHPVPPSAGTSAMA